MYKKIDPFQISHRLRDKISVVPNFLSPNQYFFNGKTFFDIKFAAAILFFKQNKQLLGVVAQMVRASDS